MAFTSDTIITVPNHIGDRKMVIGTFTSDSGSIGGDIDTTLRIVESITLQETGVAVVANRSVVNETLPADGSAITIVTDADVVGIWTAIGR